ncbi:MAG: extracellular solute-binding protein [Spirochaetota bacterium]|nr:MAG: extracellular solute-binding protein [Spirochaetota bacterium]
MAEKEKKPKETKRVSRREFLGTSLKAGAGIAAASVASKFLRSDKYSPHSIFASGEKKIEYTPKAGLAPGMIGGPTGFEGAERYQYSADEAPGRAVDALRKLKAEGKAPDKLVIMLPPGAVGHWEKPYPEDAPLAKDVFFEETGIEVVLADVVETEQTTKLIQDYQTGARAYDTYSYWSDETQDLAAAGALLNLDEFVDKYKPDWLDPVWGNVGGDVATTSTSKYLGSVYNVVMDGDYQLWVYRKDLFEDPKEKREFKSRYGWDLQWPETWEQLDQISRFFHRPDKGLLGCTDIRNQYWGFSNWFQRYTSFDNPNQYYWDDDMNPLINSDAGIQATEEHVKSLEWHHKDAISWGWPEQYANMTAGGAAITCAYPNMPKFLDNPANPDSKVVGKLRSGVSPGRVIDGVLVRRSVWWPSIGHGVAANGKYPEAAYLLLQWASSGKVSTWLTANPAGYYDPWKIPHFKDPIVIGSYKDWHINTYVESIKRGSPPIIIPGVTEYRNVLDTNLQQALSGQKTSRQAMKDCADEWNQITDRRGRDKQIKAIRATRPAWPTVVDRPTI